MVMQPEEAIAGLEAATKRLAARTAELAAARKEREEAVQKTLAEIAEQRRRGEHGRDWQLLQQRIDLGQTSEFGIAQGLDMSPEAHAAREQAGRALGEVVKQQHATESERPVVLTPQLQQAQQRIAQTLSRLRELSDGVL